MSDQQNVDREWEACEPGLLTSHTRLIHRRRLLQIAAKTAGVAGCLAAVAAGSWLAYMRTLDSAQFGLTCSDVKELIPLYRKGRLDARRSKFLEQHVMRCSTCKGFRSELRSEGKS